MHRQSTSEPPLYGFDDDLLPVGEGPLPAILQREAVNHLDRTHSAPALVQGLDQADLPWPQTPRRSERARKKPFRFELETPNPRRLDSRRDKHPRLSEVWLTRDDYPDAAASPFAGEWDAGGLKLHDVQDEFFDATLRTNYGSLFSPLDSVFVESPHPRSTPENTEAFFRLAELVDASPGSPLSPRDSPRRNLHTLFSRESPLQRLASIAEAIEDIDPLPRGQDPGEPAPTSEDIASVLRSLFFPNKAPQSHYLGVLFNRIVRTPRPLAVEYLCTQPPPGPPCIPPPNSPEPEDIDIEYFHPIQPDFLVNVYRHIELHHDVHHLFRLLGKGPPASEAGPREVYTDQIPSRFEELIDELSDESDQPVAEVEPETEDSVLDQPLTEPVPTSNLAVTCPVIMGGNADDIRLFRIRINAAHEDDTEYTKLDITALPASYRKKFLQEALKHKDNLTEAISVLQEYNDQAAIIQRARGIKTSLMTFIAALLEQLNNDGDPQEEPPPAAPAAPAPNGDNVRTAFKKKRVEDNEAGALADMDALIGEFRALVVSPPPTDQGLFVLNHRLTSVNKRTEAVIKDGNALTNDALDANLPAQAEALDTNLRKLKDAQLECETRLGELKVTMGVFGDSLTKNSELKPPSFSGDHDAGADFFTFKKDYLEYASTKPASNAQQLRIMLKTCLSGPAAALCAELTSVEAVLECLQSHYGCARVLLTSRINKFKALGPCPNTSPNKKRTWLIAASHKIKSIRKLASDHNLLNNLYFSSLLSEVRSALPWKLEEEYKERMKDIDATCTDHEEMFSMMVDFLDYLVEKSSFDVKYELALGPRSGRGEDKKEPKKADKNNDRPFPKKKSFAVIEVTDSESDDCSIVDSQTVNSHATSRPVKKTQNHGTSKSDGNNKNKPSPIARSSKYIPPTETTCSICKGKHKYLFQCVQYQKTRVKERIRLVKTTRACSRCMRMDAAVVFADRDKWWEEHKIHCDAKWVCKEEGCTALKPNRQWHITMCIRHTRLNKEREQDFVKSQKGLIKPDATLFFLRPMVYSLDPLPVLQRPTHDLNAVIHDDVNEPSIFMLQKVSAPGDQELMLFYDSGCSGSALNDRACSILPVRQVTKGPTKIGVAGGRTINVPGGDVQFHLHLAKENEQATLTGLQMPKVTTPFPHWDLQHAFNELQEGYKRALPDGPPLPTPPSEVGGVEVDVLLGIRYLKYFPERKFSLPCGLSIYEGLFKSPGGLLGILGGTHKSWRNAKDSAQILTREIFFTMELSAYRVSVNTLHHVYQDLHHQDEDRILHDLENEMIPLSSLSDLEDSGSGENDNVTFTGVQHEKKMKKKVVVNFSDLPETCTDELEDLDKQSPVIRGTPVIPGLRPPTSLFTKTGSDLNCPFKHCETHSSGVWIVPQYWDVLPSVLTAKQDLEKFENLDSLASEVTYRCLRCRNCNDCRKGDLIEQGSLEGEQQQALIERCIELNVEAKRLEASLPFIMDPDVNLTPNRGRALAVLRSQLGKVKRNPALRDDIFKAHNKLLDKGHVCAIKDLPPEERKIVDNPKARPYYLPWNVVIKESSISTPARLTYNGSSKTSTGHSLNSILAKGENKLPKIFHILIKFGSKKACFTADVSMAYNSVKLLPQFFNYQRYLWQNELDIDGEVLEFVIRTIIYGIICSGNLTAAGFSLVAAFIREFYPNLFRSADALENVYVDDAAQAEDTLDECHEVTQGMDFALELASMSVKAYTFSGSRPSDLVSADGESVGVLGYTWWPVKDVITIAVKDLTFGKPVRGKAAPPSSGDLRTELTKSFTKRTLVAKFASTFDPLGYATPVTARIKLDLSQITDLKTSWDQPLPEAYLGQWVANLQDLQDLRSLEVNRCYLSPDAVSNEIELIVQVDASEKIAVACVHARSLRPDGSYGVRLITAKSKLVHMTTVPRGELKAAVLGASLAHVIKRNLGLRIKKTLFITDSTIVMYWLSQDSRPLQTTVRNSVIEIRRLCHVEQWFHIDSANNLADLGTRDAQVSDIMLGTEWQQGKWWMPLPIEDMPIRSLKEVQLNQKERQEANKEVKAGDICGVCLPSLKDKVAERYSYSKYLVDPCMFPWPKSVRTLAFVFKFIAKLKVAVNLRKSRKAVTDPPGPNGTPVGGSDPLSRESARTEPKTRQPPSSGSDSPPPPPSPPRTRSRTRKESSISATGLYTPKPFTGFSGDRQRIPPPPVAPPREPPPPKNAPPRDTTPPRADRRVRQSLFMDEEGKVLFPNGYVSLSAPVVDESGGVKPPPADEDQYCRYCPLMEVPPLEERLFSGLEPNFPLGAPPRPPPAPPAPPSSSLRPEAPEFLPSSSKCNFPILSSVSRDKILDFQLSTEDVKIAENYFFKKATNEVRQFSKSSEYKKCTVLKDGILYFSGRILEGQTLNDPENVMSDLEPLSFVKPICDRYSPVSYACAMHAHQKLTHHRNSIATLRESRNLVYILRGRDLCNEIRENCCFCKRFKARLVEVEMGKLHQSRLTCAPAFYNCQVDLFGKYSASCEHNHRATVPVWGVIFKDPSSGAIAIYGMARYNTGAFLHAYTRHSSRYGHPLKLFIDAGSQLMKACKEMEISWTDLTTTLNCQFGVGIEHVVCTVGSHAAHGVVERSVLEVKRLLHVTYRTLKLDLYGYDTAFSFIANELNSLPLCLGSRYENLEHSDLITPSRLLLGRNNQRAPMGYPRLSTKSRQVDQLDLVHKAWWNTWKREKLVDYIPAPSKWHKNSRPPLVDDIVVFIRDEAVLGESIWKLGIIEELIPSAADGKIRAVIISYRNPSELKNRTTKRDVRKMAILYREGELELLEILNEASKVDDIQAQVQLNHRTVHSLRLVEFIDSLQGVHTAIQEDVRGQPAPDYDVAIHLQQTEE